MRNVLVQAYYWLFGVSSSDLGEKDSKIDLGCIYECSTWVLLNGFLGKFNNPITHEKLFTLDRIGWRIGLSAANLKNI